ncbi:MAG: hypothetical protein ACE5EU_07425 [Paracoccaceae bacterium]
MAGRIALERFAVVRPEDEGAPAAEVTPAADTPEDDAAADPPAIDPEAERRACLERIAAALEIVASEQAGLRARCIGDTVTALGAAAETLLPRLARAGFAALVAETAQTIARRGQWPELLLSVTPDDAASVAAALGETGPVTEVKIAADPTLGPGEAQIGWSQGGAEIDVDAIAEAALDHFRLLLDGCLQQGA